MLLFAEPHSSDAAIRSSVRFEVWLQDNEHKKSLKRDKDVLKWALPYLKDMRWADIKRDVLDELRKTKAVETSKSNANRTMAIIRSILYAARDEWEWLNRAPKTPMYKLETPDYRWLSPKQFKALLSHLPTHTQQIAKFAVATGLRKTNITHLKWAQVDFEARHAYVLGSHAKARKPIPIPLNDYAMAVLTTQSGMHDVWVFPYHDKPIKQITTKAWRKAVAAIGAARIQIS